MNDITTGVSDALTHLEPTLIELRRDIHARPELSNAEHRTTDLVADRLQTAGLRVTRLAGTGLVAEVGAREPELRVALRADLDALPVDDRTGLPWASQVPGVCHACGHDVHIAAVVGAALGLAGYAERLAALGVAVRFIFQPAEEKIPGGALEVIDQGHLEGVDRIFALHCDPTIDVGAVGLIVGPLTSAASGVHVTLKGLGGHTSRPHLTQDLTYALAKVITDVPAALSRRLDPRAGAALVWGTVQAGQVPNVIPAMGTASGTLRMLDAEAWAGVGGLVEELVASVVAPYAVTAEVVYTPGVPPVVNEAVSVEAFRTAVTALGATEVATSQSLGGEDFAWYLAHVPGAMARLGTRTPGGPTYDLHQGDLAVDEAAVVLGARVLVGATLATVGAS